MHTEQPGQLPTLMIPPHNVEAEQAVLGALMLAPETLTDLDLSDEDFYRRDHRLIFRAIQETAKKGHSFDPVTLGEWFEAQGLQEQVAGHYLVSLASTTPSAANIKAYAAIVRNLATKRHLIELGTDMVNRGFNCADPDEIISDGMGRLALAASRLTAETQEPLDLFGDHALPALNPDWLPPGIAKYAYDQAQIIGCAPEMVAFSCIGTAAAATHDSIVIKPKANEPWTERACLWMMVVAEPGSKKSPAVMKPMSPLRQIDGQLSDAYISQRNDFEREDRVFQIRHKAAIKKEATDAAGFDEPLEAPKRPANLRAIINDATVEKLGELLVDNSRGLLLYQDEIAVWFGSHDAYAKNGGGKDRGMAIQAYQGGPYTFDRIGRGTVRVPNWSYSLIGTTQPEKIKEITSKMSDDGLLQRFLVIEIAGKVIHGDEDRAEDASARRIYDEAIRTIWARVPGQGMQCVVNLSPEADSVRRDFFRWVDKVANTDGLPAMLRGHLSKWHGLWPRLCLTYHSFGTAVGGQWPSDLPISGVTARRVTALMKQYLLPQALRFYTDTTSHADPVYSIAQRAASMVLAKGQLRLTNRDMLNSVKLWKDGTPFQRQAVIGLLRGAGWLLGGDSKRDTGNETAWTVNPRVHVLYGERATVERARREQNAETMKALRDAAAGRG